MAQVSGQSDTTEHVIENLEYAAPIRKQYPKLYTSKFLTQSNDSDLKQIKTHEDKSKSSTYQTLTLDTFEKIFGRNPSSYDITEINFQNFALNAIRSKYSTELRHLSHSTHAAHKRVLRAAIYAICSREDVAWDGSIIEASCDTSARQQKRQQLEDIWRSLKLYDWTLASREDNTTLVSQRYDQLCQFDVWKMDTQSAVEKVATEISLNNYLAS